MTRLRLAFPAILLSALALAAGCGGGGGGGTSAPPTAVPTSSPSATPTANPGPTTVPIPSPSSTPQAVSLSAGGYTLSFLVPPLTGGSTTTMSANLQVTLPNGVNAPQMRRSSLRSSPVRLLASTFSGLVYLVVSTSATVSFSSAPSFTYTIPPGTIPSGQNAYVLFWDPTKDPSVGWQPLLNGTINSTGTTVTFQGVATGVTLVANTQYVYALAVTTQPVPTVTPAPTATPTSPPGPLPAYCSNFSTPPPNGPYAAVSNPQPVYITDNSGLNDQVILYVVTGADTSNTNYYQQANGQITPFTVGASAPGIPLACFPGSTNGGKSGNVFEIGAPPLANLGENIYIALVTPAPSNAASAPNPLTFTGVAAKPSGVGYTAPSVSSPTASNYVATPWDYIETGLPSATLDLTHEDKLGLPLKITMDGQTIGFRQNDYSNIMNAFLNDPNLSFNGNPSLYRNLLVSTSFGGTPILSRIIAPHQGGAWNFPQDLYYNPAYAPPGKSGASWGYLGYVLAQYATSPRLYSAMDAGTADMFCAQYDGSANVNWYDVGAGAMSCPGSFTSSPVYRMPVATTLVQTGTLNDSVCDSPILAMPWGPGNFPNNLDFYLWKSMDLDLLRGDALSNAVHPIGGLSTGSQSAWNPDPGFAATFAQDPLESDYWKILHANAINNQAYAAQYDELGDLAPTINPPAGQPQPMYVTIQPIPTYSGQAGSIPRPAPQPTAPCL